MATDSAKFNPNKVAFYETEGWKAYYAHRWGRALGLMVRLNREEFHMSLLTALRAAIDIVRASIAFAPLEDNDVPKATEFIQRFYEKARRTTGMQADAKTLTDLEMDYWQVHRKLALERKENPTIDNAAPMMDSLARLHAALFAAAPPAAVRRSAEERALAAVAVDRITGGYSQNIDADWREVESRLRQAYGALEK